MDDALQIFKLVRQTTYQLLKTLSDQVFMHSVVHPQVVHPEYGEMYTLEKWLHIYTDHIRAHIEQLQMVYQAWKKQNGTRAK